MRYKALACDYDGTLASGGVVSEPTLAALQRLLASGRKLILVTGRELEDFLAAFPHAGLFEWLVAEDGALLYRPATRERRALGEPPPERFIQTLRRRGVKPLSAGRVIVSTAKPYEAVLLEVIRDLGLELQIIFNRDSVMVLPAGVNKATGLAAALKELGLSPLQVVGIGDAENDHAFLKICGCAVAVANAVPALREAADFVTRGENGAGVVELIEELLENDLQDWQVRLKPRQNPPHSV
jgi:HAD superfamily hydrolase (TIGR01484 family)